MANFVTTERHIYLGNMIHGKDPIESDCENSGHRFAPYMFLLPWLPQFCPDLSQSPMQPFAHPKDATDKIWLKLANWS